MIRILLADDHALFRAGIRRILEEQADFTLVAEAASGLDALTMAIALKPDVVVMGSTRSAASPPCHRDQLSSTQSTAPPPPT